MTLNLPLDSALGPHRLFELYPKVLHYFETLPRIALCDRAIVEHCASFLEDKFEERRMIVRTLHFLPWTVHGQTF